uniref:Uncharacterized protein n=1 Tax=Rhizophora mucronata TaxID=61149 RepID=A0A2P2R204_RHIMU
MYGKIPLRVEQDSIPASCDMKFSIRGLSSNSSIVLSSFDLMPYSTKYPSGLCRHS